MSSLLLFLALSCPETVVVNISEKSWTEDDDHSLEFNKTRCISIYKNSPCLKLFKKVNTRTYHAVCGAPNK